MRQHRIYKFGLFSLDATAKVLLKDGQPVPITRKAVETLLVLVENAGQVVPKEEMLSAIWPDRVVEEANLTQNIAMVRRALGAESDSPAFIETFAGRGYRLIGPVEAASPELYMEIPATPPTEDDQEKNIPSADPGSGDTKRKWSPLVKISIAAIAALAAFLIFWRLTQKPAAPEVKEFHVTPLTRLQGKERQPAISPDGAKVAFIWEQDNGQPPKIYLQVAGESSPRSVTNIEGHYSSPAWSPDGRALAFLRVGRDYTEALITSIENGAERMVARFTPSNYGYQQRLLDWSPDGQWLAVSHSESLNEPNGLYLVNIATGEKKPVTKPEAMVGGDIDPHFSPDSRVISFIRVIHRSHQEVFSISINGDSLRQLTRDSKQITSHDWMADHSGIVFASDRGGEFRLWKLRSVEETTPQPLAIYGEFPIELSLAGKAGALVYSVQQQDRNIWRLNLKDKKWTRIIASSAQDASPQYSPAGDQICFRSDRTGEEQLWVSDAEGANQIQVTRDAVFPSVGRWSPDGRQIVFNNARSGEIHIAALDAKGQWSVRSLGVNGVHPTFSHDGKWIYAGSTSSILRIATDGSGASSLVNAGGFSLGVSPDGKFLYFMQGQNDTVLWKINTGTGELSKALEGLIPKCTSCWALDQNGIYFLGSGNQSFDAQAVYYRDFMTGRDRKIADYPEPLAPVGSGPFSLSPDQRHLLCVRVDPSNSDIMLVEPFR